MRTALLPILLSLLLALSGQALALGCGTDHDGEQPVSMDMSADDHHSHCEPSAGGEHGSGNCAQPDDCTSDCACCPGHCAGAMPAGDSKPISTYGSAAATAYLELNSSPEPEAAIRPPICR